ncbi:hypothetical protein D3C76_1554230 [compost metagenome]
MLLEVQCADGGHLHRYQVVVVAARRGAAVAGVVEQSECIWTGLQKLALEVFARVVQPFEIDVFP